MTFQALTSSNIAGIDYDAGTSVLIVHFKNGSRYQYTGVPADVAEDFSTAGSPGSFFSDSVKDIYPYARI